MRILVLAGVSGKAVRRCLHRLSSRYPGADIIVGVAEVERRMFEDLGLPLWILGEEWLQVDRDSIITEIADGDFDLIVISAGVPRQSFLREAVLTRTIARDVFEFEIPLVRHLRSWRLVRLALIAWSVVAWGPVWLILHLTRFVDAVFLLSAAILARFVPRQDPSSMNRQPICHIVSCLGTGGAQRQLSEYIRGVDRPPGQIIVVSLFPYNELFLETLRDSGVRLILLYERFQYSIIGRSLNRAFPYFSTLIALCRFLRQERPRCVYSWLFLSNVISAPSARIVRVPRVISSIRNLSSWKSWKEYRKWWYRPADRLCAPLNDVVVANAEAVADDYADWSGCRRETIQVIPNGVDVGAMMVGSADDIRGALDLPARIPILLTIGRLAAEKNQIMIIRSCAELRSRGLDFFLLIVGHGELKPQLRETVLELGLDPVVRFVGRTKSPQNYYGLADLFVLSSIIEGMPNVLLEAQAFGVPVVTTAAGGSREVIEDGATGFVVDVGDENGFTDRIALLLEDPELRQTMGNRAKQRMSEEYGVRRMARAVDEVACSESN